MNTLKMPLLVSILFHLLILSIFSFKLIGQEINSNNYKIIEIIGLNQNNNFQRHVSKSAIPKTIQNISESNDNENANINSLSINIEEQNILSKELNLKNKENDIYSSYISLSGSMKSPRFLNKREPIYPKEEKLKNIESNLLLEAYIDNKGKVQHIIVIKSGGQSFDKSAIESLSKSRFSPAYTDKGKPVAVRVQIPYKFELK
jgi:TonB family protein